MATSSAPHGLDRPETYAANPALAALARRLAERDFATRPAGSISRDDLKRAYLAGKYADQVAAALDAQATKTQQDQAAAQAITAPPGYRITVGPATISIQGPWDDGLHASLKRAGGAWDSPSKTWKAPADKAVSLKRILAHFAKRAPAAEAVAARKTAQSRQELLRWLGYVEDKAPTGYLYQNGVDQLRELGIHQHPDLQSRLDAALTQVRAIKQAAAVAREAARQARIAAARRGDKLYLNVPYEQREMAKRHGARWDPARRAWYVFDAVPAALQAFAGPPEVTQRRLFPLADLPPLQQALRLGSQVVVFTGIGQTLRISAEDPSVHGSQVLGHEGERGAFGYYRLATEEETAALEAQEQAAQAARAAKAQVQQALAALRDTFRRLGERPMAAAGQPMAVDGERLLDTQHSYGGGDWWVIQPDAIWYIVNNGRDGDDWSYNNVRTGGAGAIGWRRPYDPAVAEQLRAAQRFADSGGHRASGKP